MKKILVLCALALCLVAAEVKFQTVAPSEATLLQTGVEKQHCPTCSMDLVKHYKTSHAVKLKDGSYRQYCSIHCLVEEMEMGFLRDKKEIVFEILVADTKGLKMIPANKAFYVIGSRIKGTMSGVSKYAFATKADAEDFKSTNGGKIGSYDDAYKATMDDFKK
ncbi:MAG: nitrous oxide reductase accessory protein NosL [Sulfuricurvum sp.]